MAGRQAILRRWGFPHQQDHGVTLVARNDAVDCVKRIIAEGRRFYGYDSFTVFPDGSIQPHLTWSPDWSHKGEVVPPVEEILSDIRAHPSEVTHYEFVFEDDL